MRFLLLAESLLGPAQVFIVVVLEVGLLDVVALEDGLALSDAQVVGCGCGGGGGSIRAAHLPPKYIRQRGFKSRNGRKYWYGCMKEIGAFGSLSGEELLCKNT